MMPVCTATKRLVETLNRTIVGTEAFRWPGNQTIVLETLMLAFAAPDITQAFAAASIRYPTDVNTETLAEAYNRLRGRYRADAIMEPVESYDYYIYFARTWGTEINRQELAFLLTEAPKLVGIDKFKDFLDEAASSKQHSLPWVMSAARRTSDRRNAGRRRIDRLRDSQSITELNTSKEPAASDAVASMLLSFQTAIRDAEIIKKHEEERRSD